MTQSAPSVLLNNGIPMPQLGLGVWQTADGAEVESAVKAALDAGYRLIDTAALYGNEGGVGNAIRESGVPREELFVTTKLWNSDQGDEQTVRAAFNKSLETLGLDYIDLYLIHWPMPAKGLYVETWKTLEKLYQEEKVRAIGVSNFQPEHLEKLISETNIVPAINQIELHPYLPQHETRAICEQHGIAVESWSPIGGSRGNLLQDDSVVAIAKAHGKSPAQVIIRWHIQNGLIVIPKSVRRERIEQNIDVFDFDLTPDDMEHLAALENGTRMGPDPATLNTA